MYENFLSECPVGSVVEFDYYGGSNPGGHRKVEILGVRTDGITAKDLTISASQNQIRHFKDYDAVRIRMTQQPATQEKRISFQRARKIVVDAMYNMTSEELAECYGKLVGAVSARYDSCDGDVIVTMPAPKVSQFSIKNDSDVEITARYVDGNFEVDGQIVTAQELAKKIANHVLTK